LKGRSILLHAEWANATAPAFCRPPWRGPLAATVAGHAMRPKASIAMYLPLCFTVVPPLGCAVCVALCLYRPLNEVSAGADASNLRSIILPRGRMVLDQTIMASSLGA